MPSITITKARLRVAIVPYQHLRFHAILPIFQLRLLGEAAILLTGERSTTELRGNKNFKRAQEL